MGAVRVFAAEGNTCRSLAEPARCTPVVEVDTNTVEVAAGQRKLEPVAGGIVSALETGKHMLLEVDSRRILAAAGPHNVEAPVEQIEAVIK
jgi:hypothetical protein